MAKQVTKTPQMRAQMQKILGDGVDVEAQPVFEALAANTLPINKRGSIYNKSQMTAAMLNDIANHVNTKGLPLHDEHRQGAPGAAPRGKVFSASVMPDPVTGDPVLHSLFSVSPTEADVVSKLDQGILDEVSLGVLASHALCSECGFDFMGDGADVMNWINRTCANDHVIGDGAHLNLTGLDSAYEMSTVSRGAVQGAKVVSGPGARMAAGHHLMASGIGDIAILYATAGTGKPVGEYGPDEEAKYADPGYQADQKPRYPLAVKGKLNEGHIRSAWSYINIKDNADKYTAAQVKEIKDRVIAAWKAAIDSGGPPSAAEPSKNSQEHTMADINLSELIDKLTASSVSVATLTGETTTLKAEVTRLTAELSAAKAATPDEAQVKLTALQPDYDAAVKFMREQAKKALVATGVDPATADAMSVADLAKTVEETQLKLSTLFPAGGRSKAAVSDAETDELKANAETDRLSAFKTRR